ncbi:phosphotransferase family protein [Alcanivorax sp. JB21]|uniref:phosphotransferase family protein n=1 Tax=Alcanivorax limicola TaxID=2874102 RepID=UPI001CBC4022|nr:phosphotransferase family protein [Alcanivorax limicola]MBZ2188680.1 phosphotransferase family protein [Alcanivorax limicola]
MSPEDIARLEHWLADKTGEQITIGAVKALSGGAIQENWAADIQCGDELIKAVIRCDAASAVGDSLTRAQEFALLKAAYAVGVTVPGPLWQGDAAVLGRDFFIMRRAAGTAAGHRLVRDKTLAADRPALVRQVGREMARIHSITPPREDLAFLTPPAVHPALLFVQESRAFLDQYHSAFPGLEWGLRWLETHLPTQEPLCLVHRDFRTGNYMVDEQGLTAVLDWEFTTWSQPLEDLGWFCARCWRFGQLDAALAAGGMGPREALFEGYREISGRQVTEQDVYYWEVFAHVRWAMIAIKQGERHISGQEPSLELALTAHIVPELELHILAMTGLKPDS